MPRNQPAGFPADHDLDELLGLAEDLARRAGDILLGAIDEQRVAVDSKSSPTDLVTEWDRRSEAFIVEALSTARPGDGVLGEEGGYAESSTGVRWIIDPLDGTTNFLYGLPPFAVSIAAEIDGVPAVGVVVDVLHAECYTAALGRGSFRNGVPIRVSGNDRLATALVATGFSYDAERRRRQATVLPGVLPAIRDLRRGGAASVDLCWVACGRLDGYWEGGTAPWDFGAGAVIAREAGAIVGDLDGGPPSTAMVLAATPDVFEPLVGLLRDAGAGQA